MSLEKLIDLTDAARAGMDDAAFWASCTTALSDVGVTGVGYGIIPYRSDATVRGFTKAGFFRHTYSSDWSATVEANALVDDDISVELIANGIPEVLWNDDTLLEHATGPQQLQSELEGDLGMKYGASLSLNRNSAGQAISGIGLWVGDAKSDSEFSRYWQAHRSTLRRLSFAMDEGIRRDHMSLLVNLTPREHDCLSYLAIGLRPAEICWTLKISEKTFEKHIKGAKGKLRASTRDHAVAKSLVLGLIKP
ncbi:MAG: helix-turn-helix transcriptional regulator [Rhodobacterales bacterium]